MNHSGELPTEAAVVNEQQRLHDRMEALQAAISRLDTEALSQSQEAARMLVALAAALGVPLESSHDPEVWTTHLERTFDHWLQQRGRLELENEVARAKEELAQLREEAKPLEERLNAVEADLQRITAALAGQQAELAAAREQIEHCSRETAIAQQRLEALQEIAESLKAVLPAR